MVFFELATQTVPYHGLNEKQMPARLIKYQAAHVPEVCKRRVPKFAGLMEACWKVQGERPEASRLVEVLAEARAEYSEEGAAVPQGSGPDLVASGFIGLSMNT